MPRRSILSAAERESLLALPENPGELIRLYTFSDADLAVIRQHRGAPLSCASQQSTAVLDAASALFGPAH